VPGVVKVKLYVAPVTNDPLLNNAGLLVAVWVKASLFVQVTAVPALIVIVAGSNAIPCMNTSFAPGVVPGLPPVPPVPVMFDMELLEQLADIAIIAISIPIPNKNLLFELKNFFIFIMLI
jgi:hypothetical protein